MYRVGNGKLSGSVPVVAQSDYRNSHENLSAIVVLESCDPRGIMSVGICKLCLEEKELHDSHLIPKGVYKSLRSEGEDATSVTATKILQISWQFHAHLLCRSCEDRLNKGGEMWVLKHMARQVPRPQFLLFDLLNESALCEADDDGRVYASTKLPQIDTAKLAYFALSMFWRTTIHEWKGIDGFTRRLSLGSYASRSGNFFSAANSPNTALQGSWCGPTRNRFFIALICRAGTSNRVPSVFVLPAGNHILRICRKGCPAGTQKDVLLFERAEAHPNEHRRRPDKRLTPAQRV